MNHTTKLKFFFSTFISLFIIITIYYLFPNFIKSFFSIHTEQSFTSSSIKTDIHEDSESNSTIEDSLEPSPPLIIPITNKITTKRSNLGQIIKQFVLENDKFLNDAYFHEINNYTKKRTFEAKKVTIDKKENNYIRFTGKLSFGNDSIFELLKLLKDGKKATANTVANASQIGNNFAPSESRTGNCSQEEGMMACFDGLFRSLLYFAERDDKNEVSYSYRMHESECKTHFYTDLQKSVLYSPAVKLRIPINCLDDFVDKKINGWFTNYLKNLNYKTKNGTIFKRVKKTRTGIYSVACYDIRGIPMAERDDDFYNDTEQWMTYLIETMLLDARKKLYTEIVVTIPEMGIFTTDDSVKFARKDTRYLEKVKNGVAQAIKNCGGSLNIIVCGLYDDEENEFSGIVYNQK